MLLTYDQTVPLYSLDSFFCLKDHSLCFYMDIKLEILILS